MKRAAVALILALCLVGVAFLFMEATGERVTHRDAAGTSGAGPGGASRRGDRADEDVSAGDRAGSDAIPADDDDPNRVTGPPVTIRGRVVRDGQGITGAVVTARRARPWFRAWSYTWASREADRTRPPIGRTDTVAGGTFELQIARRRSVVLRAMQPGSAPASLRLFLPETGDPDEVTLRLQEGTTLFGIVLNEESQPVADAAVRLSKFSYQAATLTLDTKTEPDGRFVFADLADGGVSVLVEAEGYPPTRRSVTLPEATHIQFVLGPGGTIVGRVTDSSGAPLADARVLLTTSDTTGHSGRADVRTDPSGEYRVASMRPGTLNGVTVEHPSCGRQTSSRRQIALPTRLVKAGQELRFDIRLEPGVPVRGRTVMANAGSPVAGARVALLRMSTGGRGLGEIAYATSGEDGRFDFPHVSKGTYAMEASAAGAGRRAVRYTQNNRPLTIDFYVDGEQAPPEQRLELSPMGAVRGSVVGYRILPRRRLSVRMETPQGSIMGQADDVGHFAFENVPPMEGAVVQCWNPQAKSDPFTVEAGRIAEVVLDPSGRGGFVGVVEDEQGRPIAGAAVQAMAQNALRWNLNNFLRGAWNAGRTDDAGRFLVAVQDSYYENNRVQQWVVVANHPDHVLGMSKALKLPKRGDTVEVRIVLKAAWSVRGRVEFEGGGPVPNVRVTASPKKVKGGPPYETRASRSDMTDFDGRFEVPGIAEGVYILSASYRHGKVEAVEVRAGDRDLELVIRPTASIAGFVVDGEGQPMPQAQVSAIIPTAGGERKQSGVSGQGGRFTITHLDPGAYPLVVEPRKQAWSAQNPGFETKQVDPVATGTEELVIVVSYGPTLKGRVIGHGGGPVPGAGVIAMPPPIEKGDPRARWKVEQQLQRQVRPSGVTDGRGDFEIKGLGTDEVELLVLAQGHVPTTRRAVAGAGKMTLRLDKGGVIEGRILKADGTPLARQWLRLRPSKDIEAKLRSWRVRGGQSWSYMGGWQLLQGRTDPGGAFRFQSLLPGEYTAYLTTNEGVLPATNLRTDAGAVTLRLQPPLTIRGRIVDTDGRAIDPDGTRMWINARQGQNWSRSAAVASDGTFEIKGVPPGTVTLQVWSGNRYKAATIDVTAGDLAVTVMLEPKQPKPKPKPK